MFCGKVKLRSIVPFYYTAEILYYTPCHESNESLMHYQSQYYMTVVSFNVKHFDSHETTTNTNCVGGSVCPRDGMSTDRAILVYINSV
jgi:hypothetical protein